MSCIERCPHFRGKFILREHIWDIVKCPYSGVSFKKGPTVFPSLGGGGGGDKFNSVGLDHSGSQPFQCE